MSSLAITPSCYSIKNYFDYLPDEIVLEIFKKLDFKTLASSVPVVCRRFERISKDDGLFEVFYPLASASMQVFNFKKKPYQCPIEFRDGFRLGFLKLNFHEFIMSWARYGYNDTKESKTFRMDLRADPIVLNEFRNITHYEILHNGMFYFRDNEGIKFFDPETQNTQILFELPETEKQDFYLAKDHLVYSYKTSENRLQLEAYNLVSKERKMLKIYDPIDHLHIEHHSNSSLIFIDGRVIRLNSGEETPLDTDTQLIGENELITKPTSSEYSLVPKDFQDGEYHLWRSQGKYCISSFQNPDLFSLGRILEVGKDYIENYYIDGKYLCARVMNNAGLIFTKIVNMDTRKTAAIYNKDTILAFFNGYIVTDKGVIDINGNPSDSFIKKLFRRSLSLS